MKFQLSLAMAAAMFAGAFTFNTAQADDGASCIRDCRVQYRLCLQYTPEKEHLCYAFFRECMTDCGAYN